MFFSSFSFFSSPSSPFLTRSPFLPLPLLSCVFSFYVRMMVGDRLQQVRKYCKKCRASGRVKRVKVVQIITNSRVTAVAAASGTAASAEGVQDAKEDAVLVAHAWRASVYPSVWHQIRTSLFPSCHQFNNPSSTCIPFLLTYLLTYLIFYASSSSCMGNR